MAAEIRSKKKYCKPNTMSKNSEKANEKVVGKNRNKKIYQGKKEERRFKMSMLKEKILKESADVCVEEMYKSEGEYWLSNGVDNIFLYRNEAGGKNQKRFVYIFL